MLILYWIRPTLDIVFRKDIMKLMITKTAKIRNGVITLPKKLQKPWKEAEVFVFPNEDTLIIKKIQEPLSELSNGIHRAEFRSRIFHSSDVFSCKGD